MEGARLHNVPVLHEGSNSHKSSMNYVQDCKTWEF